MIKNTLNILLNNDLYNCGEYTEIAKGKHELVTDFKSVKRKIKRAWLLRKL